MRRMLWMATFVICAGPGAHTGAKATDAPALNCDIGPLKRTYGTTAWDVYGCDDGHSVVAITAAGSPAMPFYFFFVWGPNGFDLRGEGGGNKSLTDAAFEDLKKLSEADIEELHREAVAIRKKT